MRPLSELPTGLAASITCLATDVDGTLTTNARLSAALLARLESLARAGIELVPVSGRPAGEVLALCRYLPGVSRGVAENGMIAVRPDTPSQALVKAVTADALREVATELSALVGRELVLAPDGFCRLADLAFEREDRALPQLTALRDAARERGLCLVWSNVHIHLSAAPPDKGHGLLQLLGDSVAPPQVAVIGDAPNDAGLFVRGRFGLSVGTAQVADTAPEFDALPMYVTDQAEGEGFCALVDALLAARA